MLSNKLNYCGLMKSIKVLSSYSNISLKMQKSFLGSANLLITRSTTILCVRKNGKVVMAGDGQVSQGSSVVKGNARKVDWYLVSLAITIH